MQSLKLNLYKLLFFLSFFSIILLIFFFLKNLKNLFKSIRLNFIINEYNKKVFINNKNKIIL